MSMRSFHSRRIAQILKRVKKDECMRKNTLYDSTVAVVDVGESESMIRWYAERLTGRRHRRVCVIRRTNPLIQASAALADAISPDSVPGTIRQLSKTDTIGMLVCEWSAIDVNMQTLLHLANELGAPAVFIRHDDLAPIKRVVVATAGGPNVLDLMWIAKELASAYRVPTSILHCRSTATAHDLKNAYAEHISLEAMGARLLGMHAAVEVHDGQDFTQCIGAYLRQNDLLVLGAPSPLRRTMPFADSIPEIVAKTVKTPMVLLSSPPQRGVDLRRLFWGGLIKTGARFRDKQDAISSLIQNLANHNQLPRAGQSDILDRALRREQSISTAVDCETAFPHVRLRGFFGLAAAMAICPDGVAFGSMDGQPTRFFYFMITPDGLCEDYLAALARISRRMIMPKIRAALLACKTPAQVLDILEPREMTQGISEARSPVCAQADGQAVQPAARVQSSETAELCLDNARTPGNDQQYEEHQPC